MAENYFVFGDEDYLVHAKIQELSSRHSSEDWGVERLTAWQDVQDKLCTAAMFSAQRVFLLDYGIIAAEKPSPEQFRAALAGHGNVLILYAKTKPDKRTKLFKATSKEAQLIEVTAPRGAELQHWLVSRARALGAKKIESRAAAELVFYAGSNMFALENELKKLINYHEEITLETVRTLAVRDAENSIFALVDFVVGGNTAAALNMVEELVRGGAQIPYLLFMLSRQYRFLFRILFYRQKGYSTAELQKILAMHPYVFKKTCQQAASISIKDCADNLQELAQADYDFKTGRGQGLSMMQMLILKLVKK
jgi:DNA polymerase-3 subunit delta